jgi:hypothetical protein
MLGVCLLLGGVACDPKGTCFEKAGPNHAEEDYLILNTKKSGCVRRGEFTKEDANTGFLRGRAMGFSADKRKTVDDAVKNSEVLIMTRAAK